MALHFTRPSLPLYGTICTYDYDSIPSPVYSDITDEDVSFHAFNIMSPPLPAAQNENIHDVLDDILIKVTRVADHLRSNGQNEAANRISRDVTSTFRYIYEIIQPYSAAECVMKSENPHRLHSMLSNGTPQSQPKGSAENTWAAIAATAPVGVNQLIKHTPEDAIKRSVTEQRNVEYQGSSEDRRVVWVQPWAQSRPLDQVSKIIKGLGAIFSVAYAPDDQSVCIIFQHAYCAMQFLRDHADYVGRTGQSKFGPGIVVLPGHPFPINEDLRRMEAPFNERRRLTFARQQLFSHGMTEKQFTADLEAIVGSANIELIWLFNTGNATAVFSAVPLARLVRDRFRQMSSIPGSPYEGIMISFSHDPSERDLHLVTQMQDGISNGHHIKAGSIGNVQKIPQSRRQSTTSTTSNGRHIAVRRPYVDSEGWQTVGKKR